MAVMDVIEEEALLSRTRDLGSRFKNGLEILKETYGVIGDVRGRGLFLGFEMVSDRKSLEPASEEASLLVNEMRERGVLLSTDGPLHNVIKIKPPLVLNEDDVDGTLSKLDYILSGVAF